MAGLVGLQPRLPPAQRWHPLAERRPIILMSALYRVWAGVRAAEFRDWLRAEGVLPPAPLASAELRAEELACTSDLSMEEVLAIA